MNVQDIITRVRRTFGDEAAVQVTDDDIIRWINDAQVEIVKHNDAALQTTAFDNLVADQSTYTLPVDLLVLRTVRYKYDDMDAFVRISYKSMQQFDEEVDGWDGSVYGSSNPVFFTKESDNIILFPTPDQSATGGLKILYNKKPVDVTTPADNLALPLLYHNTVVRFCLWQASLLDDDPETGIMYQRNFEQDINVLTRSETKDPVHVYPTITVLEYDL